MKINPATNSGTRSPVGQRGGNRQLPYGVQGQQRIACDLAPVGMSGNEREAGPEQAETYQDDERGSVERRRTQGALRGPSPPGDSQREECQTYPNAEH
ncbi:MAG: hypothetical protein ACJ8AP_14650 [Gemmatimonadales bacterium]